MPRHVTPAVELTHVSLHGFWLLLGNEKLLVRFSDFPWFRDAMIAQVGAVERPTHNHLYWQVVACVAPHCGRTRAACGAAVPSPLLIPILGYIIPYMSTTSPPGNSAATRAPTLSDALFTKVQQRVLGIIFGNPERSFYANEIIRLAGSGTGAVQRELAKLQAAGLVVVERVGNQKHFRANERAPVFEELRSLVLKTSGLADVVRTVLAPVAPQIQAAFLFGSLAKGEATASSDVDLMLISDTLGYPDLFAALEAATQRLGRTVNPTIYTRSEFAKRVKRGSAFLTKVLTHPKIWLIGSDDALAS